MAEARTPPTPTLDALLARLSRRMVVQTWLFGVGTTVLATAGWLAFAFLADRLLHVPAEVRWVHLGALVLIPALVAWRALVRPLRRIPDRAGSAVLLERAHPELAQLLVSAVQLARRPNGSPELVAAVVREAERRARELDPRAALDPRAPRRRALAATAALALGLLLVSRHPDLARIFAARLIGLDVAWPQRTTLSVEIPLASQGSRVDAGPERIDVLTARGTDVPIVVRAAGVVPAEVRLLFGGGRELELKPSPGGVFRTLLRSCREDVEFSAVGGDDRDGQPRVSIHVLDPPDVAGLAVAITPPAYTGRASSLVRDRDVEVLAGSRLAIAVLPEPPGATGVAQLLPADESVPLVPVPWPGQEGGGERTGLGFELTVEAPLRYRFLLSDERGLENPDPGLFAVHVVEDRIPDVTLVTPARNEVETTAGGLLRLVARAEDDFGVVGMAWSASLQGQGEPVGGASIDPVALDRSSEGRLAWSATTAIELAALAAEGPAVAGTWYEIVVSARDNRPEGGVGHSVPLRLRVVSEEELLRRVQDRLVRVRGLAGELETLARQKGQRTLDLIAGLEEDDAAEGVSESELLAARTGARRVLGDSQAVARELAGVAETVLYARLDDKAGALLTHLDEELAQRPDRRFHADLWLDLAAGWREGRLGSPGFAGQLVGLVDVGLAISEVEAKAALAALDEAAESSDVLALHEHLLEAAGHQARAQARIEDLLERLAEWDNFQSILTLTRDILNRQKALEERTRNAAREK